MMNSYGQIDMNAPARNVQRQEIENGGGGLEHAHDIEMYLRGGLNEQPYIDLNIVSFNAG
jgi:hypothetical protein